MDKDCNHKSKNNKKRSQARERFLFAKVINRLLPTNDKSLAINTWQAEIY
jgi:hypothetical protein